MKKNFFLLFSSILITLFLIYLTIFIKVFFEKKDDSQYLFNSLTSLNFHKKYSNILNHLRNSNLGWDNNENYKNFLYSVIEIFEDSKKNILFQGDSWIEQINLEKQSLETVKNFSKENNLGIINGGTTSFSPTPMKLQYKILKKDFNIKPTIVIAYIDQTDIGDEICRYKNKRYFDTNNNLLGIKREKFSRSIYDYSKIYKRSEIFLNYNNNLIKNFHLTNFFIEFKIKRLIVKIKNIGIYGLKDKDKARCYYGEIQKYLKNELTKEDKAYFLKSLENYINVIIDDPKIQSLLLITFPHRNNLYKKDHIDYYKVNVSYLVDEKLKEINSKKIKHINFTKDYEKNSEFDFNIFRENDPASHLNEIPHNEIFIKKILNNLKKVIDSN